MPIKEFKSGFIREADYDPAEQQLDLSFDNKTVLAYQGVPNWIFEKLSKDPSPKSFWEDHIRDEFSAAQPRKKYHISSAKQQLNDLFGSD
jgi:hypothetical protein